MKLKHNKKRNTAILYETLIRELTKAVVNKKEDVKQTIVSMLKEHFSSTKVMAKELKLYNALCETYSLSPQTAEKLVVEIRKAHQALDKKQLFNEQTALLKKINSKLGKTAFSSFLPSYKSLASIYQIFNEDTPTKERVILEEGIINNLTSEQPKEEEMKPVDSITFKTFSERFNVEYQRQLFEEQKHLLGKYVSSFVDNGIELKIYLNEEISRLKEIVSKSLNMEEIKNDADMVTKTKKVLETLSSFRNQKIEKKMVEKVLQIQQLAREIIV